MNEMDYGKGNEWDWLCPEGYEKEKQWSEGCKIKCDH